MVVMRAWPTLETGTWHERVGSPSRCTVQAPHWATPQPYLVPVNPSASRSTQRSGMSAGTSADRDFPFTLSVTFMGVLRAAAQSRLSTRGVRAGNQSFAPAHPVARENTRVWGVET